MNIFVDATLSDEPGFVSDVIVAVDQNQQINVHSFLSNCSLRSSVISQGHIIVGYPACSVSVCT